MLEQSFPLSRSGGLILCSVYTGSTLKLCRSQCAKPRAQGVSHPRLQGHGSYSSNIPMQLCQVSCPLAREVTWGMGHGSLIIVGTAKHHLSHGFLFGEVLPKITTSPSHPHTLSLRTPPSHGQVSGIPLCLSLHYST